MATLTIKNIPTELYQGLKQLAIQHRRSLNSEAIISLEQVLHKKKRDVNATLIQARKLRAKFGNAFVTEKELSVMKNEGRA